MKRLKLLWLLLLLLALAVACASDTQEQNGVVTDDDVNRVARELYCPICENTPLDVCETQACEDWRELIREKLEAGQSDREIIEYFAEIYGERARATPTTRGLSLAIWIAPVIGVIIGVVYFARLLRRWLARGAAADLSEPGRAESATVPVPMLRLDDASDGESEVADIREPQSNDVREPQSNDVREPQSNDYVTRLEREIRESS